MQIGSNGDFQVITGEIVTVTVTASDTKYLAAITPLAHGSWIVTTPPNVPPGSLKEVREFVVACSIDSFDIGFGFLPPPGSVPASYHVNIVGNGPGGAPFDEDISNPGSPIPPMRDYTFVTS